MICSLVTRTFFIHLIFYIINVSNVCGHGLDFLVLGDWGGLPEYPYWTPSEVAISKQLVKTKEETNSSFVIALGDNFYFDGVRDVDDKRFQETYEHVFKSLQLPWYVVAGNHDHHGNVSAQVAYTQRSDTWKFPKFWYSQKSLIPGTNFTMKIVFIDTVLLCGNTGYDEDLTQPNGPEDVPFAESQWRWIEDELKYSKDEYLLVAGHFPVWSAAKHGPTACLVERLKPLLLKYDVTAYFSGHDHNLQHIEPYEDKTNFFVIGCANFVEYRKDHVDDIPSNSLKFFWADIIRLGGFAHVHVNETAMTVNIKDAFGASLYQKNLSPRKNL